MRRSVAIIGVAFAVALAVVVGSRMSPEAMAVVVGVVCGVLASVPTSLLLIWALGRRGQGLVSEAERLGQGGMGNSPHRGGIPYPPIVVVNPGPGYGVSGYGAPLPSLLPSGYSVGESPSLPGSSRIFRVVGEEETREDAIRPTGV
jgi:hypothetical protein